MKRRKCFLRYIQLFAWKNIESAILGLLDGPQPAEQLNCKDFLELLPIGDRTLVT